MYRVVFNLRKAMHLHIAFIAIFLVGMTFATNECTDYTLDWSNCLLPVTRTQALTELISLSSSGQTCASMAQISAAFPQLGQFPFKGAINKCIRQSGQNALCVDYVTANPCTCIGYCADVYPIYQVVHA
jgi:hypothetical protein